MEIIKTLPGDSSFYLFEDLPEQLYPAPRFRHKKEDFNIAYMYSCYLLLDNGRPKARAALYQNPGLFYQDKKVIAIGNYEAADDDSISGDFLNGLIQEAQKLKGDFLVGPMNGSTWDDYRFSLHNNYDNFLLEPYHPIYYNRQFLSAGFKTIARYASKMNTDLNANHKEVLLKESYFFHGGLTIRNMDPGNFDKELEKLYPFICRAFQPNFLFSPLSKEAFIEKFKKMAGMIDPQLVLIAEDEGKNTRGFIFCYDDLLNKNQKGLVIKTLARDPLKKWSGLGSVLANRIISDAAKNGYQSVIHAFMKEDGSSTRTSAKFSGKMYKEYALYGLQL